MSTFDRIGNVIKGKASVAAGTVERANPKAVYESAIEGRKATLAEFKTASASLVVRRNQLAQKIEHLQTELKPLMTGIAAALQDGDDDTALVLEQRRQEVAKSIETTSVTLLSVAEQVEETKDGLARCRQEILDLKDERARALAKLSLAEAQIEMDDLTSGMSDNTSIQALNNVRESVQRLKAKAHAGYLDEEGNSIRGKAQAMGKKAAERSAMDQLATMKADLAAKKKNL
ncbi:MAG: hypothetical protein GWP91_18630 [Rhodobacterales bacterium]|nr:hypothetical protein [Rhodobacterales bacterium]